MLRWYKHRLENAHRGKLFLILELSKFWNTRVQLHCLLWRRGFPALRKGVEGKVIKVKGWPNAIII